jgi:hypothetical protein
VLPTLPAGLWLDPSSGLISGSTTQPITANYDFVADDGTTKAQKSITLTSALVMVLANNGTTWVPCENIQAALISKISGDGTNSVYTYSGPQMNIGSAVTIWGSSNPIFNDSMLPVSDATSTTFTVPNQDIGSSTGGYANLSSVANVQQVLVSTVVSGSPLHRVITKAMP